MIALEQARQHLETLGLKQAVEVLDNTLDAAASKQLPYPEMLAELLGVEVAARRERYLTTRTRLAHLPFQRTLEQFAFQPSIDERLVKELANLAFVTEATNVLLLGPPGVGKTHLAIALALRAIENGHGAYFVRAYDLMEDLRKAKAEHNLGSAVESLPRSQGARRGRIRHLALRPGVGHRLLHSGVSSLRTGQHHPHFEQGLQRVGRTAGRQRDRLGGAGPAAAPQPRAEHPRGELPAQRETPGGAIPVATATQREAGGGRRQLRALTELLSKTRMGQLRIGDRGSYLRRR